MFGAFHLRMPGFSAATPPRSIRWRIISISTHRPARLRRSHSFFDTHPDTWISCLPTCQSPGNHAKYEPITCDEYALWYATRNYVRLSQDQAAA
jgi:hypothetical protein